MDSILKVCMPPPTVDDKELEVKDNKMNGETLEQTYSDGTVGMITVKDDEKEPESFVIVTRVRKVGDQDVTTTLKKSKAGYKMKDTNIFNCFDEKIKAAKESGGSYAGSFSTTQVKGEERTKYTRSHDNGKETFIKEKITVDADGKESAEELEKVADQTFADAAACTAALEKFTGMKAEAK